MTDSSQIVLAALAAASTVGAVLCFFLAFARTRVSSVLARGLLLAGIIVAALWASYLLGTFVTAFNATEGMTRVFIHPGPVLSALPIIVALIGGVVGSWIGRKRATAT